MLIRRAKPHVFRLGDWARSQTHGLCKVDALLNYRDGPVASMFDPAGNRCWERTSSLTPEEPSASLRRRARP